MNDDKQIRGLMIVESRMLKIKLCFYWKRKKKRIDVPMTRSYFYLFLSHMHVVLSRGAQWNHRKMSECSIFPNLSIHYHLCLVEYIHPGRISPLGSRTVELPPDLIYLTSSQIYPMYQTYLSLGQVLVR
jgi:hypothetical protein